MSWFSTNYEKAALGGAAVVALGLAYFGWAKYGSVDENFSDALKGSGNNNSAVQDAEMIPKAIASLAIDRTWNQALAVDRPVDLFTGIPLFVASAAPDKPLDPITGEMIHPPIPNPWWIENRIDPGYADSPNRDPDKDGFSNLEEYNAKSDPNDVKSIPSLIAKLMYVKDESLTWVIQPRYGAGQDLPFNYQDSKGAKNTTGMSEMIVPGGVFFKAGVMANRFKYIESQTRQEMNPRTNSPSDVTYAKIEDQRPNKKGVIYEFPAPLNDQLFREHYKYDRTAVFSLEALGMNGKEFKVEENTTFALPPENPNKDYLAKIVTPTSVTIEFTTPSGEKKTVQISKGEMPTLGE